MEIYDITAHKGEFFRVLGKTEDAQVAAMTLRPGEDSGPENLHPGDQVVYVIEGSASITIEGEQHELESGMLVQIPGQAQHRIENTGDEDLFILNVYAPPAY